MWTVTGHTEVKEDGRGLDTGGARQMSIRLLTWLLIAAIGVGPLPAQAPPQVVSPPTPSPADNSKVALGPGDTVLIDAMYADELNKEWRIGESGTLHLPMVGAVAASGMTPGELENDLRTRYAEYIREPKINVFVSHLRSRPVTVAGAVAEPGVFQLEGVTTVFDSIVKAGGFLGAGSRVSVTRKKDSGTLNIPRARWVDEGEAMTVDLRISEIMKGFGPEAELELRPGDLVYIEPERDRMVYVSGEVNAPGSVDLDDASWMYITEALLKAGGAKKTSKMDKVLIWRKKGNEAQMTYVDLKAIMKGKAEDQRLLEGDYLYVPPAKDWSTAIRAMTTTLSIVTAVSILTRY